MDQQQDLEAVAKATIDTNVYMALGLQMKTADLGLRRCTTCPTHTRSSTGSRPPR